METINKKDIIASYLQMCNQNDVADAVIKYCDEDHGLVLNKHFTKNKDKHNDICDYSSASLSGFSNISNSSYDLKGLIETDSKSFSNTSFSKCYYANQNSLESLDKNNEKKDEEECTSRKNTEKKQVENNEMNYDKSDDIYEIIAPEGKGKFLKFIGENYVYVLLEDGTYNCYPIDLLKLNRAYLNKNAMYKLNFNYKNMAFNHTKMILKSKNNRLYKKEDCINKGNKSPNKFLGFTEELNYLKDYLTKNDKNDEKDVSERDYLVHLYLKNTQLNNEKQEYSQIENPIKKNIMVKTLNNEYKIENTSSYAPVDYISTDDVKCNTCC